jgi:hypothetical protein
MVFTEPNHTSARKQAIAVTQATTVTLTTSNSKGDTPGRQATSRNENNNRTANTI